VFFEDGGIDAGERRAAVRMYVVCERIGGKWAVIGLVNTPEEAQAWVDETDCFHTVGMMYPVPILEAGPCE
jgi:hypothetical protein